MSTLLRLPFVLLVALAAALAWAAPVAAEPVTPTVEECLATPTLDGCTDLGGGDGADGTGSPGGETDTGGEPGGATGSGGETGTPAEGEAGGTGGGAGSGGGTGGAGDGGEPAGGDGDASRADAELVVPITPPPGICAEFPTFPGCPESPETPGEPLTCDQLAELLGLPECPDSFTCEDLAELLGVEGCPDGPPTCQDLAELFGLEECPEPPASCEEFADLLGLDNCEQIPCLDTSQLPDDAEAGLAPLLDALEQIGVKACPPKPVTGGGNNGGGNPPPTQPAGQPYYENCDDARAQGKAPVYASDPGYRAGLDSDDDGIGCEETAVVTPVSNQSAGRLAYTGIDLELWLRAAAILLSSGTLFLLAGRRRA